MRTAIVLALMSAAVWAHADMFKPSRADQLSLGKRAAEDLRRHEKMLPANDARVILMRRIGAKLLATFKDAQTKQWEFSFDIVDSKELNAFALPGGPIFFYRGLVDKLQTEDQLAAVLGHEMTHVRKEHWAYGYADNLKRRLGLQVVLTLLRANDMAYNLADISDDLLFTLPYSRKHESEADALGCDAMVAAGYNPQGMIDVFKVLREGGGGGKMPEFMSDHPDELARIKKIQERVDKMNRTFPPEKPIRADRD